jgi:hypothetical protein
MPNQPFQLTPDKFAAYMEQLPGEGLTVNQASPNPGDAPNHSHGQVTGFGCVLNYTYDGATLSVIGISKPFIVSWQYIFNLIAEHLA